MQMAIYINACAYELIGRDWAHPVQYGPYQRSFLVRFYCIVGCTSSCRNFVNHILAQRFGRFVLGYGNRISCFIYVVRMHRIIQWLENVCRNCKTKIRNAVITLFSVTIEGSEACNIFYWLFVVIQWIFRTRAKLRKANRNCRMKDAVCNAMMLNFNVLPCLDLARFRLQAFAPEQSYNIALERICNYRINRIVTLYKGISLMDYQFYRNFLLITNSALVLYSSNWKMGCVLADEKQLLKYWRKSYLTITHTDEITWWLLLGTTNVAIN